MGLINTASLFRNFGKWSNSLPFSYAPVSYSSYSSAFTSFPPLFKFNSTSFIPRFSFGNFGSSFSSYRPASFNMFSVGRFSAPKSNFYNFSFSGSRSYSAGRSYNAGRSYSAASAPVSNFGSLTTVKRSATGDLQRDLVNNSLAWVGKVNNDATGNRLFSPGGKSQAWCADFVTYNTTKTFGSKLPSDFGVFRDKNGQVYGPSAVSGLQGWAGDNNCYLDVTAASNKSQYIAQNVKPGDIMIEKRGGKSHTGIVTKVHSDGSFETVEGNTSNKVGKRKYSANSSTLSGFISLDKYAA